MTSSLYPKTLITVTPLRFFGRPMRQPSEKAFADFVADLNLVAESNWLKVILA
jgi:hypothetical protein